MKGYKFTEESGRIYIIELEYETEHKDEIIFDCFYTTKTKITKIYDADTNTEISQINGKAFIPFLYSKGQEIENAKIYFCKTLDDLFRLFLCKGSDNHISRLPLAETINNMLKAIETPSMSFEEVYYAKSKALDEIAKKIDGLMQ